MDADRPTWAELHARGLTAREAADARGRKPCAAFSWARRNGVKWAAAAFTPVTIRGCAYPTIAAAARATGFAETTIITHLDKHGHFDRLGIGRGKGTCRPGTNHNARPITIGGTSFPTRTALARWLGVTKRTVQRALRDPRRLARLEDRVLARRLAEDAARSRAAFRDAEMVDRPRSAA